MKNASQKKQPLFTHPLFLLGAFFTVAFLMIIAFTGSQGREYKANLFSSSAEGSFGIQLNAPFTANDVKLVANNASEEQQRGFAAAQPNMPTGVQKSANPQIPSAPPINCTQPENTLLLDNKVVLWNVRWRDQRTGNYGCAGAIPHLRQTGHFWFFNDQNIELTTKALNGIPLNGYYWIFAGALTDAEWWMTAVNYEDPSNSKDFYNAPGTMASFADTAALQDGPNNAPQFTQTGLTCGSLHQVPGGATGFIELAVQDSNGDPLTVNVTLAQGSGMSINPQWNNPVNGSGAPIQTYVGIPTTPGDYWLSYSVNDNTTLFPPVCMVGLRVL